MLQYSLFFISSWYILAGDHDSKLDIRKLPYGTRVGEGYGRYLECTEVMGVAALADEIVK